MRRHVAAFAQWGFREVYVDWCGSFPWGLDERFHAADAYREDFVAGLAREARGRGIVLGSVFPAPDSLGAVARLTSYRRLFRRGPAGPVLELATPSARSFYAQLIDDYLRLLPEAATVLIDCRPEAVELTRLAEAVRPFREQGLRVVARYCGTAGRMSEDLPVLLEGFDFVALPLADATSPTPAHAGRVIAYLGTQAERDTLPAPAPPGGEAKAPSLLLCFQPEEEGADTAREVSLLGESIEVRLEAMRLTAARLTARARGDRREEGSEREATTPIAGLSDLDRRLGEALAAGWRSVRSVREALRDGSDGATLSPMLEALAEAYRKAVGLAGEVRRRLVDVVEAGRLERALGRLLGALYEEHLELCGRAGISVVVAAPDEASVDGRLDNDRFSC